MTIFVTKFDGTKQAFSKQKIVKTCLRMGSTIATAEIIAGEIEKKIYDGIETKKILQMIFRRLRKHKPILRHQVDLRKALSLINPAPDFERFIQLLLQEYGYEVSPNQIVKGKCGEHEIDAIAKINGQTCIVEVKHHFHHHTRTNLDIVRISRAILEDVTEGYELGLNNLNIDYAMIVCNTKLTEHAKRYAQCRGIRYISWSSPPNQDLQKMIREKKLYPLTFLRGIDADVKQKLMSNGIILLKQLILRNLQEISSQTGISKDKLESISNNAKKLIF